MKSEYFVNFVENEVVNLIIMYGDWGVEEIGSVYFMKLEWWEGVFRVYVELEFMFKRIVSGD